MPKRLKTLLAVTVILLIPICVAYGALIEQSDGTVLDNVNNLLWSLQSFGEVNWTDATSAASSSEYAGYTDWRLPTLAELSALVDSDYQPQIPPPFKLGRQPRDWTFWTSGTIEDDDFILWDRAYIVFFGDGTSRSVPKGNRFHYRLIRDYEAGEPILWDTSNDSVAWTTGGDLIEWD